MQMQKSKIDMGKALNVDLVMTKSSGTESGVQDDNNRSGNDTDTVDAYIRPIYEEEPTAELELTTELTQYYLPKRRESIFVKPDHMIASSESRNSSKNMPRFSSNDMVHNHYIDEARKKTQERDRNLKLVLSPNKTSDVYEKTSPRSDLRWKPMGRIFKSIGLRWIPTGKLFDSCTIKVDIEPPHDSNVDISKFMNANKLWI
nr:hypothetical protein [Tanacetum cinerariifolium]